MSRFADNAGMGRRLICRFGESAGFRRKTAFDATGQASPARDLKLQTITAVAQDARPRARIRRAGSYFLRLTHSGDDRVTGQPCPQPSKRRPEIRYLLHRT